MLHFYKPYIETLCQMPRGGIHKGTLKPDWKAGKTTVMRVPIARKEEFKAILKAIDTIESEALIIEKASFLEALNLLKEALNLRANAGGAIKEKIREALAIIDLDEENDQ